MRCLTRGGGSFETRKHVFASFNQQLVFVSICLGSGAFYRAKATRKSTVQSLPFGTGGTVFVADLSSEVWPRVGMILRCLEFRSMNL